MMTFALLLILVHVTIMLRKLLLHTRRLNIPSLSAVDCRQKFLLLAFIFSGFALFLVRATYDDLQFLR